ncbi:MAG: PIN domain-containing protein [Planctomycetota bacterium]|nr:PIN domain-containing protein [Planctomycetota bacterium]
MNAIHVLIDFESVQPEALAQMVPEKFHVSVFVGANQAKLSYEFAAAMQELGSRGQYVKISGVGMNALDFHIAYYIGRITIADPAAAIYIVSRDTGFDPLIQHLLSKRIKAKRFESVYEIPGLSPPPPALPPPTPTAAKPVTPKKPAQTASISTAPPRKPAAVAAKAKGAASVMVLTDPVAMVLTQLQKTKANKPRTVTALSNAISSVFHKKLSDIEVENLIKKLENQGWLKIDGKNIVYSLR